MKLNISKLDLACDQYMSGFRDPRSAAHVLYEIRIKAANSKGEGPVSPSIQSYTGQYSPRLLPLKEVGR